jgi:hypothetical protein
MYLFLIESFTYFIVKKIYILQYGTQIYYTVCPLIKNHMSFPLLVPQKIAGSKNNLLVPLLYVCVFNQFC